MFETGRRSQVNELTGNSPCLTVFHQKRADIAFIHVEKRAAVERITTIQDRFRPVCLIGARRSGLADYPVASRQPTPNADHLSVVIASRKIVNDAVLNKVAFGLWISRGGRCAEAESFLAGCFVPVDVNKMHVGDFVIRSRQRNAERAKIYTIR